MTSIGSLATSIKRLEQKLPTETVRLTREEWVQLQQLLTSVSLCDVCHERVRVALLACQSVTPTRQGYTQPQAIRLRETIYHALEPCVWCRVTVAATLMGKKPDHYGGEHLEGVLSDGKK